MGRPSPKRPFWPWKWAEWNRANAEEKRAAAGILEAIKVLGASYEEGGASTPRIAKDKETGEWHGTLKFKTYEEASTFIMHLSDTLDCFEANVTPTKPVRMAGAEGHDADSAAAAKTANLNLQAAEIFKKTPGRFGQAWQLTYLVKKSQDPNFSVFNPLHLIGSFPKFLEFYFIPFTMRELLKKGPGAAVDAWFTSKLGMFELKNRTRLATSSGEMMSSREVLLPLHWDPGNTLIDHDVVLVAGHGRGDGTSGEYKTRRVVAELHRTEKRKPEHIVTVYPYALSWLLLGEEALSEAVLRLQEMAEQKKIYMEAHGLRDASRLVVQRHFNELAAMLMLDNPGMRNIGQQQAASVAEQTAAFRPVALEEPESSIQPEPPAPLAEPDRTKRTRPSPSPRPTPRPRQEERQPEQQKAQPQQEEQPQQQPAPAQPPASPFPIADAKRKTKPHSLPGQQQQEENVFPPPLPAKQPEPPKQPSTPAGSNDNKPPAPPPPPFLPGENVRENAAKSPQQPTHLPEELQQQHEQHPEAPDHLPEEQPQQPAPPRRLQDRLRQSGGGGRER